MTGAEFLRSHVQTMAACDFFTTEVWTPGGMVTFYVLFVIEIATRRVEIAGITASPDSAWMAQVVLNLTNCKDGFLNGKTHLIMDRDTKFTAEIREILQSAGAEPVCLPPHSPNLNAYAERFVRSIKEECQGRMIFFGDKMFRTAVQEYTRPLSWQAKSSRAGKQDVSSRRVRWYCCTATGPIGCRKRLGGLLNYYHRRAA